MRYFLSFFLPPLAVLMCGKPVLAFLNCFLTLLGWLPGVLHALLVVNAAMAHERNIDLANWTRR